MILFDPDVYWSFFWSWKYVLHYNDKSNNIWWKEFFFKKMNTHYYKNLSCGTRILKGIVIIGYCEGLLVDELMGALVLATRSYSGNNYCNELSHWGISVEETMVVELWTKTLESTISLADWKLSRIISSKNRWNVPFIWETN